MFFGKDPPQTEKGAAWGADGDAHLGIKTPPAWFREITSVHSVLFIKTQEQKNSKTLFYMQAGMRKAVFSYVALAAQCSVQLQASGPH